MVTFHEPQMKNCRNIMIESFDRMLKSILIPRYSNFHGIPLTGIKDNG